MVHGRDARKSQSPAPGKTGFPRRLAIEFFAKERRMPSAQISAALDAAWRIGADSAMRSGSEFIEPIHLLYGIFQLKHPLNGAFKLSPAQQEEVRREVAELAAICSD